MGCGASAPGSAVQERSKGAAAKVSVGAKAAGAKAAKAAGALKRSVSERFTNPEDDPTVPELLSRAMRRLRTALTHCDPAEIKAATENGSRNVAAVKSSTTATDSLLELIWAAETFLARVDGDGAGASLAAAGWVDWLHLTQDAATPKAAKLPQSSVGEAGAVGSAAGKARKGAGRLMTALRAVLKDGDGKSMLAGTYHLICITSLVRVFVRSGGWCWSSSSSFSE